MAALIGAGLAVPGSAHAGHGLELDHPYPGLASPSPPSAAAMEGGKNAEWDLVGTVATGNPHTDLDFFTQDGDTIDGVDFPYLARVTRLNVAAMAALAKAPAPPEGVKIEGAVSADTKVSWTAVPGASRYRVWWRATTEPQWRHSRETTATTLTLPGVVIDDWFFGVSAVAADGSERQPAEGCPVTKLGSTSPASVS